MSGTRKIIFVNNYTYHVFNRGVERRPVFTDKYEYRRAINTVLYYQQSAPPLKLSRFLLLSAKEREQSNLLLSDLNNQVRIHAYCLMPNHFHFLLTQTKDNGISTFISKFTNSYTRFFNIRHSRTGHLFQGAFKAVMVESQDQLIHLSRYIHLNPVAAALTSLKRLDDYPWSSYSQYINSDTRRICDPKYIMDIFNSKAKYQSFIENQAKSMVGSNKIKHLTIDGEEV